MNIYTKKSKSKIPKPAIFLDRDGTLIYDRPGYYLTKIENIKFYKNVFNALKILKNLGYLIIIITNQSAIARGYITLLDAVKINMKIKNVFSKKKVKIDGIYLCPHKPSDKCKCRKPDTGLIKEAGKNHMIDMKSSYMIGDKISDILPAKKLKVKAIFLKTGHGKNHLEKFANKLKNVHVSDNILHAAMWLKAQSERNLRMFLFAIITSLSITTGYSQTKNDVFVAPLSGLPEIKIDSSSVHSAINSQPEMSKNQEFMPDISVSTHIYSGVNPVKSRFSGGTESANFTGVNSNWYREKLEYEVFWGFFKVGKACLFVEKIVEVDGNPAYHIVSTAESSSWLDNFYTVNDRNESWMDVRSFHSYGYLKSLREGKFAVDEWVTYNTKDLTFLAEKKDRRGKVTKIEGKIPGNIIDVLSSLYFVRTKELKPKTDFVVTVNTKKNWDLKIVVHEKEKIETPSGKFECLVVEPMLGEEGIFVPKKGKRLLVYFTNDNLKIPVMLKAEIFIGSISAKLVKRHFQQ